MHEDELGNERTAMFCADRNCRKACDQLLLRPQRLTAKKEQPPREKLQSDLNQCIKALELAYRGFFQAVCRDWPSADERHSCLDDLKFRHGQQMRSLSYLSSDTSRLKPLAEIVFDRETSSPDRQSSALKSILGAGEHAPESDRRAGRRRPRRRDRKGMDVSALFAELDVEKLEENEETGALIEWLRQELSEEEAEQVGTTDDGTASQGAAE